MGLRGRFFLNYGVRSRIELEEGGYPRFSTVRPGSRASFVENDEFLLVL